MRRTPLKRVSARRRKEGARYTSARRVFLKDRPTCECCMAKPSQDVHHKKGRGQYYLDEETWMAVCRACHVRIHEYPKWARREGFLD